MHTLADKTQAFLASGWKSMFRDGHEQRVLAPRMALARTHLRKARRFTLDNSFVERAVHAASTNFEDVMRRAILARLPFDYVWIEMDQQFRTEVQIGLGTSAIEPGEDRGWIGYLMQRDILGTGWTATPFISDDPSDGATIGLVSQVLGPPPKAPDGDIEAFMRDMMPSMVAGWGAKKAPTTSDVDYLALLDRCFQIGQSPPEHYAIMELMARMSRGRSAGLLQGYATHAKASRGDLRFLIAVLALLNHTPVEYQHVEASGRFTHRLKTMEYLDSHVVTLKLGGVKVHRILNGAVRKEALARRRHEVRGTWRVVARNTTGTGCRHLPVPETVNGDYATCGTCGHRIRWVKDHMRGDASLGFVAKEYVAKW